MRAGKVVNNLYNYSANNLKNINVTFYFYCKKAAKPTIQRARSRYKENDLKERNKQTNKQTYKQIKKGRYAV